MNTVKQYLGKVSFTCNGEHDINKSYDRLCIVYTLIDEDENAIKSYISRKAVPPGINISNKEYWQPINVSIGDVFTEEDRLKLDGIETGATKLFLGITHNDAADGYFANKLNNVVWNTYPTVANGDVAFQPGVYSAISRGCPNFIIDGVRKWLGGFWTFFVVSGYNKDSDKYHILQFATCNNPEEVGDSYAYNKYVRHITYDSLYTWEGNTDPVFDEWEVLQDNRKIEEKLDGIESGATKVITNDSEGDGISRPVIIEENKGVVLMPEVMITDLGSGGSWNLFEYLKLEFERPLEAIGEGSHLSISILEATSTRDGIMSSEDYIKLFNIEEQATKSRIYQGSNPMSLHDLLFNGDNFHVETNGQTHEITLDNRRLVITPNLSTHIVDNTDKRTIEYCFRKYGDLSKLWAKIVSPGSDTFHLYGVTHYEFMLTRLDETDEVYEVVVRISFGDIETEYISITYTAVDLSDGFEAYDLTRGSLGLI